MPGIITTPTTKGEYFPLSFHSIHFDLVFIAIVNQVIVAASKIGLPENRLLVNSPIERFQKEEKMYVIYVRTISSLINLISNIVTDENKLGYNIAIKSNIFLGSGTAPRENSVHTCANDYQPIF